MLDQSLLPPNATDQDKAIEAAVRLPAALTGDVGVVGRVADCPAALLPWLAAALSVDTWDANWSDERKRAVIADSVQIHRRKGTIGAVRRAIAAFGYGQATITEGRITAPLDGSVALDGSQTLGEITQWATYRVFLSRPITAAQAQELRAILDDVAPARCALTELNFVEALGSLDGSIPLDGTFNLGVA